MWRDFYVLTYRHLRRRGVPHFDAEDIAQEVLASAYVNIEGIDPARLRGWLLAAARNKMVDRYRGANRLVYIEAPESIEDPDADPAKAIIRSLDAAAVRSAIQHLSERDARLVVLHYFEERSLAEIAETLSMSATAVKVALFRARRRLRRALEDEEAL